MVNIDPKKAKDEWIYFLRNSDIFTTTERSVTTDTDTGTFAADSSHLIDRTNIKNVRSVIVAGSTLTYGSEYYVNVDYDDSGTIKCRIVFVSAQTGAYTISYDYGTDIMFADYPKTEINISNFPRLGTDILSIPKSPAGHQGVEVAQIQFQVSLYSTNLDQLDVLTKSINDAVRTNYISFYYVGKYVHIINIGAKVPSPYEVGKDKVWMVPIDVVGDFNYEK